MGYPKYLPVKDRKELSEAFEELSKGISHCEIAMRKICSVSDETFKQVAYDLPFSITDATDKLYTLKKIIKNYKM